MKSFNQKGQGGFTIVELVVVIVILGILAAVALPRFMDASERAHDSAVIGTKGALGEGVALFKAQWFVNGNSKGDSENNVNDFGDGTVDSNEYGFPVKTTDGAGEWCDSELSGCATDTVLTEAHCAEVWAGLLGSQAPTATASATADVANGDVYSATVSGDSCTYEYLPDPVSDSLVGGTSGARTITYNTDTGDVTTNVQRFVEENT